MTPNALTKLLYQEKALQRGYVLEVHIDENKAFHSQIQHLQVSYSPDAAPQLPAELVLKKNVQADWAKEAGHAEVAFYKLIAAQNADRFPMVIPYVAGTYDEQTGDSLLLIQDMSATHHPPVARRLTAEQITTLDEAPSDRTLYQIVETLAAFHAAWWEHPQLGTPLLEFDSDCLDEERFLNYCQHLDQN